MKKGSEIEFRNEFAHVVLSIDYSANGPRLCIIDRIQNRRTYLDPLQLECLTRMYQEILDDYLPY
jgi:hypothetical protein